MTEPYPLVPSYPPPPSQQPARPRTSGADLAVSWLVWALLALFDAVVALVMLFAGFVTGLSCASDSSYGQVCTGAHGDVLWVTGIALWVLMFVATFGGMTMMIVQTVRGGRVWPWSVAALVTVVIATAAWFGYLFAVS